MEPPLHTVVETDFFLAAAKRNGVPAEVRAAIVDQIAADPTGGDLVQGSGGVRKVRFGGSGGYRVMVAYLGPDAPAFLLSILSKGSQANFSDAQVGAMRAVIKALKQQFKMQVEEARSRRKQ